MDVALATWLTSLHLGPLHPVESLLVVLLAFGPFVVLGLVVAARRRQDARDEAAGEQPPAAGTAERRTRRRT